MRTKYSNRNIADLSFGDSHLKTRQAKIISDLSENLSGTLPELSKNASDTKALYRFFKNPQVTPDKILHCHSCEHPISLQGHKRILHVMDTVEYDMTSKKGARNLGPMNYLKRRGLYQHNSLLLTQSGAPLVYLNKVILFVQTVTLVKLTKGESYLLVKKKAIVGINIS